MVLNSNFKNFQNILYYCTKGLELLRPGNTDISRFSDYVNLLFYESFRSDRMQLRLSEKGLSGILLLLLLTPFVVFPQKLQTPLERKNFEELSKYNDWTEFVKQLDVQSDMLQVETIGQTVEGRDIVALKFSKSAFGQDESKTRVLIFAQQHGNEPSGKEGALLLAAELIKPENSSLFDRIDLALIPQVNGDGSENNKRCNAHDADLNRNHLIMEEPEVIALHRFFDKYLFEVTMDVHEYAPFSSEKWKKYGYRTNSDELIGVNTNCNVSQEIRDFSNDVFVPLYLNFLKERQFSSSIYAPGGPPEMEYIRHSTYDVNDGRQSFGIQNTFSLIQEGLNGEKGPTDRIRQRANGQKTGMRALLEFTFQHATTIKKVVEKQRNRLINQKPGRPYALRMEHVRTGKEHPLPVYSYLTGNDSVILVKDYRPLVKSVTDVTRPLGYLVPKSYSELVNWTKRQALVSEPVRSLKKIKAEQYLITSIDSIDFERDTIIHPKVKAEEIKKLNPDDFLYFPVKQLKGNILITALEPASELGLVTYSAFSNLVKAGEKFPVLRVVKK
jgi:hypothetical protein